MAYLGHQDAVKPGLTVTENLRFAAAVSGRSVTAALAAVGLEALADLPARMLSAGQKRRLALSRLVLSTAPLWLLDEPTLGLDTASIERFGDLLAAHRAGGGMVVAATHVPLPLPDAAELAAGLMRVFLGGPVARPAAFAAARRGHAGGAAVLPGDGVAVSAGDRAGAGHAGAHRARHRLGVRAAGGAAAAGPAVRRGPGGWLAGPAAAVRPAGVRDRRGKGGCRTGW